LHQEARVDELVLYARLSLDEKTGVVLALRQRGHTVGFLGDGVNDAPAIHAADVGLSVDGATDVAREAADLIMLVRNLGVLADGVDEGRRTFANILKYVRMATSSNFGNMLSMALASIFLPFLLLTPIQVLLNNLIYDLSEIGIPFDLRRAVGNRASAGLGHGRAAAVRGRDGQPVFRVRHRNFCNPRIRQRTFDFSESRMRINLGRNWPQFHVRRRQAAIEIASSCQRLPIV
jgi:hypothetical protein